MKNILLILISLCHASIMSMELNHYELKQISQFQDLRIQMKKESGIRKSKEVEQKYEDCQQKFSFLSKINDAVEIFIQKMKNHKVHSEESISEEEFSPFTDSLEQIESKRWIPLKEPQEMMLLSKQISKDILEKHSDDLWIKGKISGVLDIITCYLSYPYEPAIDFIDMRDLEKLMTNIKKFIGCEHYSTSSIYEIMNEYFY